MNQESKDFGRHKPFQLDELIRKGLATGLTEKRLREALEVIGKETKSLRESKERPGVLMVGMVRLINEECKAALALPKTQAEKELQDILGIIDAVRNADPDDHISEVKVYQSKAPGLDYKGGSAMYLQDACRGAGLE